MVFPFSIVMWEISRDFRKGGSGVMMVVCTGIFGLAWFGV